MATASSSPLEGLPFFFSRRRWPPLLALALALTVHLLSHLPACCSRSSGLDDLLDIVYPFIEKAASPLVAVHQKEETSHEASNLWPPPPAAAEATTPVTPGTATQNNVAMSSEPEPWCGYHHLTTLPTPITWQPKEVANTRRRGKKKRRRGRRRGQEEDELSSKTCIPMTPVLVEGAKAQAHGVGCRLGLYEDVSEAWSCLRGKHLVFVGDSVMRFQYINMVQALEHGQWDQCRERPSNAWARHWGGPRGTWNEFFRGVNERLRGNEVCDCQRAGPNFQNAEQVENRYYYNPEQDIRVSFFLWYGIHEHLPQGHYDLKNKQLETITQESLGCSPGECGAPSDWKFGKIQDFLRSPLMVSNVRPDILILNTGLHGPVKNPSVIKDIVRAAKQAVSETNGQVYWKTTTTRSRLADTYDDSVAREVFLESGLRVLDEGAQTVPIRDWPEGPPLLFYHDKTHYKDTIYSGLNQLVLHAICLP